MKRTSLFVLLMLLMTAVITFAQTPPQNEERFQKTFALSSGGTIDVENYKGLIRVEAADQQQVTVDVWKRYQGNDDKNRQQWAHETQVSFDASSQRVKVRVDYPTHTCFFDCNDWGGVVELVIRTPKNVNLRIDGYKPDMKIAGTRGDIRIHSYKSDIEVHNTVGGIDIDTYKGEINLTDVDLTAPLRVHSYRADATISARALSNGGDLESYRGSLTLRLPENVKTSLDISGDRHASISSGFTVAQNVDYGSKHISGDLNGGGPRLRIHTERGSIVVQKTGSSI